MATAQSHCISHIKFVACDFDHKYISGIETYNLTMSFCIQTDVLHDRLSETERIHNL
jgi:hypothetical protein